MHKPRGPQPFPGLKLPLVGTFWGVDAYRTNTGDAVYRFCMMLLVVLVVLYCGCHPQYHHFFCVSPCFPHCSLSVPLVLPILAGKWAWWWAGRVFMSDMNE